MPEITQEELDKFQNDFRIIKTQIQKQEEILDGRIRSVNIKEFRNTYVINAQDSLDNSYPMYVYFNIISEMVKVVSVKVDFWILNYRSYTSSGIYEEDTSPTINFYVSESDGDFYSDVFGEYTEDKLALDITSLITTTGSKLIKFESDVRARLSVQVMVKLDISAR